MIGFLAFENKKTHKKYKMILIHIGLRIVYIDTKITFVTNVKRGNVVNEDRKDELSW